jgi:UDP-N-acetylmuramoyl-tripeptide--D-alanyl-D-alanine ligase
LGNEQAIYHREAGKQVKQNEWDFLVTVGPLSLQMADGAIRAGMNDKHILSFENSEQAADHVASLLEPGDLVLVKGSRGIRMEKIVERLKKRGN